MAYLTMAPARRHAGMGFLGDAAADDVNDITSSYVRKIEAATSLAEVERQWSGFIRYERLWRANPSISPEVRNTAADTVQAARLARRAKLEQKAAAAKPEGPGFFDSIAEAIGAAAPVAQQALEARARRKEETRLRREARRQQAQAPSTGGGWGTGLLVIGGLGLALFVASKAGLFKK